MQISLRFHSQFLENWNRENFIWSLKFQTYKKCVGWISLGSWADYKYSPVFMLCTHVNFSSLVCGENFNHEYTSRIGGNFGGFKHSLYKYVLC